MPDNGGILDQKTLFLENIVFFNIIILVFVSLVKCTVTYFEERLDF